MLNEGMEEKISSQCKGNWEEKANSDGCLGVNKDKILFPNMLMNCISVMFMEYKTVPTNRSTYR